MNEEELHIVEGAWEMFTDLVEKGEQMFACGMMHALVGIRAVMQEIAMKN